VFLGKGTASHPDHGQQGTGCQPLRDGWWRGSRRRERRRSCWGDGGSRRWELKVGSFVGGISFGASAPCLMQHLHPLLRLFSLRCNLHLGLVGWL